MKKQVHYAILADMQKYIEGIDPDDYQICAGNTDRSVIEFVREHYEAHLPVDLSAWARVNRPDENLIYAKDFEKQVSFVNSVLSDMVWPDDENWEVNTPMVISTHYSKSIKLPVYQIDLKEQGIEITLRNNFYDWKISVKSDKPLDFDCMGLFNSAKVISSLVCEGFPKDKVYGSYARNHSQFTIELSTHYDVYIFFFLLMKYLGIQKEG